MPAEHRISLVPPGHPDTEGQETDFPVVSNPAPKIGEDAEQEGGNRISGVRTRAPIVAEMARLAKVIYAAENPYLEVFSIIEKVASEVQRLIENGADAQMIDIKRQILRVLVDFSNNLSLKTLPSFNLSETLQGVVEKYRSMHPDVQIMAEITDDISINGDVNNFLEAIQHGINNAIDAMTIERCLAKDAKKLPMSLSIRLMGNDEFVSVEIKDVGPGVPRKTDEREALIKPGKGLSIIKKRIGSLGGYVSLSNNIILLPDEENNESTQEPRFKQIQPGATLKFNIPIKKKG